MDEAEDAGRGVGGDWTSGGGGGVGVVECVCGTMCDGEIILLILWSVDRLGGDENSTLDARIEVVSVVNGCSVMVGWVSGLADVVVLLLVVILGVEDGGAGLFSGRSGLVVEVVVVVLVVVLVEEWWLQVFVRDLFTELLVVIVWPSDSE